MLPFGARADPMSPHPATEVAHSALKSTTPATPKSRRSRARDRAGTRRGEPAPSTRRSSPVSCSRPSG